MRHHNDLSVLIPFACFFAATSCSDGRDGRAESNSLQPYGGRAGAGALAGAGGSPAAGAGGSLATGAGGGSASVGAPGAAGSTGASAAAGGNMVGDAGPPDSDAQAGEPSPLGVVSFSQVFAVLQTSCTPCHAMQDSFLPAFAQADEAVSYDVTQQSNGDEFYYERIIARAVFERTMPPLCSGGMLGSIGCLSAAEAALLQTWADQGAMR